MFVIQEKHPSYEEELLLYNGKSWSGGVAAWKKIGAHVVYFGPFNFNFSGQTYSMTVFPLTFYAALNEVEITRMTQS